MKPRYTKFVRDRLEPGMWIHVRSNWWLGRGIRFALNKWERRVCRKLHIAPVEVWGNHDGIIITPEIMPIVPEHKKRHIADEIGYGIGEALSEGSVVTSLERYERDLASGHLEVRVFQLYPADRRSMREAVVNWARDVEGHGYDYRAYIRLISLAFFGIDVPIECRDRFYCTEGIAKAFSIAPPGMNVLQDKTPTPLHVEQVSGLVPMPRGRRITLEEVTQDVMS